MAKKKVKKKKARKKVKEIKEGQIKKPEKSTLIITEKPQAAAKIAAALSGGTDEKISDKNRVSYYEFEKNGRVYYVGCAVGHLFGLQELKKKGKKKEFPNFEIEWRPNYERKAGAYTKKYYSVLKKLCKGVDEVIVATDFDVEGEVIGWNCVRFICGKDVDKRAKRMKFSSLTKDELDRSYENLLDSIEWGNAIAGETRHYLDWFYGINLSRGLMRALAKTGKFRILSIGRVQGPALKVVVDRERDIQKFKPEPFWQVFLQVKDIHNKKLEVEFPKNVEKESELLKFKHLKGKKGYANTDVKEEEMPAPLPFDLTSLQTEAYRKFRSTPTQTLRVAQRLYLAGVISYPRTSSQEYPESIGYDKILKRLKKYTTLVKYAKNKKPTKGKKKDPAHPAIYPTGEFKKLSEEDGKIYDLIVKRFISCFCEPAVIENTRVSVEVNGLKFNAKGVKIKEKNWLAVYKKKIEESEIPHMNGEVDVKEIRIEEKMTKPPRRYSPASLVRMLEKKNLGTKATRASIVETLYSRGYIKEKSIEVTELGMRMAETLEKYSPKILDENLTKEMEVKLEEIQNSNSGFEEKEEAVLGNAKKSIQKIAKNILEHKEEIGQSLADANEKVWEQEKEENTMTPCPVCGKGRLRIMYGRKFKRYFVSCDAYPNCKTTFSLPPNGLMKPAKKKNEEGEEENEMCQECGFPLVVALKKGRRPWKFCFNPECPTRKEYEKNKEEIKKKFEKKDSKEQ